MELRVTPLLGVYHIRHAEFVSSWINTHALKKKLQCLHFWLTHDF